jgi:hypothetical protein
MSTSLLTSNRARPLKEDLTNQCAQATIDDHGAAGQTGTGRGREMTMPSRPLLSDWPPVCGFCMMARTRTARSNTGRMYDCT